MRPVVAAALQIAPGRDAAARLAPGSSVPRSFDHLEDRNVGLYARHRAELETPARALA